jgi:SAM-dependent methyltransferase
MSGVLSRRFWTGRLAARLARMSNRRGVRWLLRLQDRLAGYTLGVIKLTVGRSHPKHRVTDLHESERVLDVGCAYGQIANAMAGVAAHVTGVDPRADAIAQARVSHRRDNLEFIVSDLADVPDEPTYDVVVLSNLLEHIRNRTPFLDRCRALGPRLLVRVPAIDRDWLVSYRRELGLDWRLHPDHDIEYSEATLRAELEAAGFRVDRIWSRFGAVHCVAERA